MYRNSLTLFHVDIFQCVRITNNRTDKPGRRREVRNETLKVALRKANDQGRIIRIYTDFLAAITMQLESVFQPEICFDSDLRNALEDTELISGDAQDVGETKLAKLCAQFQLVDTVAKNCIERLRKLDLEHTQIVKRGFVPLDIEV